MSTNNNSKNNNDGELRSKSLTSINTITSLGFPDASEQRDSGGGGSSDDDPFSSVNSSEITFLESESHAIPKDVICLLVRCKQHDAIAFKQIVNDCYFLPTFQFDDDSQSLSETIRNVVNMHDCNLLSDEFEFIPRLHLIDLYRVEFLKTRSFVLRYIFEVVLHEKSLTDGKSQNEKNKKGEPRSDTIDAIRFPCICSANSNNKIQPGSASLASLNRTTNSEDTVWIRLSMIPSNLANIWGGEPLKIYNDLYRTGADGASTNKSSLLSSSYRFTLSEIDSSHPFAILRRTDWLSPITKSIRSNLPTMFDAAVFYLYNEFVVQCFPSNSMGFSSFGILLDKLGLVLGPNVAIFNEYRKRIFRAIDRESRYFVNFEDICIGLMQFDSNNDVNNLAHRHGYIFRYYDANSDGRLELEEYKCLLNDYAQRNANLDSHLSRIGKSKTMFVQESLEHTWNRFVERNSSNMNFDQYCKAFDAVNQHIPHKWWLPQLGIFEQIFFKFNCRNFPESPVQCVVDKIAYYNRCEICDDRRFMLSSSLIQMSDIGNILKIFHLKATTSPSSTTPINFVEEFQEKNIHSIANEFLIRIEKIGMLEPNAYTLDPEEEENAKNYFFPTRHKMLKYLHLILEYAKPLIDSDAKVLEISSPCYVFGDMNGSLRDLLRFSQTAFRTFPFIDLANLLFLGNYTDSESTYNLETLIYLICLKILSPTRVFLLRGSNELAGRQQIQIQDKDKSDEPLNDIVCNLLAQIFDSFPIAAVIEERIFASHSGFPKDCSLSHMKLICQYASAFKSATISGRQNDSSAFSINFECEDLMEELLLKVINGEPNLQDNDSSTLLTRTLSAESFTNCDFEQFLSTNKLFFAIRSHHEFKEDVAFRMQANFNLATIVSSASKNEAKVPVCIFIDCKHIRIIRLDANY